MKLFLKKYGFYMIVTLCVAAVAVSSYYAVNSIVDNIVDGGKQPSDDAGIEQPEVPVSEDPEPAAVSQPKAEPAAEPATDPAAAIVEPKQPVYVKPANGNSMSPFSGETLVKNETLNEWRTHNGVDYAALEGDTAVAVYGGKILSAEKDGLWGYKVNVLLDTGYTAVYCGVEPNDAIYAGIRVEQGDVIGKIGASTVMEASLGRHLHFEMTLGGKYVDPAKLIPQ